MLKILQGRIQQYMNCRLPHVQAGFRKARGTRDQIANIYWIIKKAKEFQKNIYFCFIDYAKAFDCVDHNKLWKFWKRWEYQTTWPASWETCMQVRKQQLELDMEQQFSSVTQLFPTLCDPMDCNMIGLLVHHQLWEITQTHVHWVSDAIQPSHPLLSPYPPALNLSKHQRLLQ